MSCPAHALAESRRYLTSGDVDLIRRLCAVLDDEPIVVDLGAGSGTTAGAVFAERPSAFVMTVDIEQSAVDWAEAFITQAYPDTRLWCGLTCDSVWAARIFGDDTLDLLLIDSSHEYDHTVAEIAAWLPKVKRGAAIWCHDYTDLYPGVRRAVDEAVASGVVEPVAQDGWSIAVARV